MGDKDPDLESALVDLTQVDDLIRLGALQDSALGQALDRVKRAAENPAEATFSFQQSI